MILAGGRGRACRVSARWRAGRPSRGCSGIPGERFDAGAQCCHEPPAVSRAQLTSAEHSLITATPPPRCRFACATPGSRAATRSSAQTALYAACQRALQPGGALIATSGRLARIADTPMPPCCLPPSIASVPTSAIPRRSPCYACPYLREACTRKQCITAGRRAVIYTGLRVVGRQVRQRASGRSVYLCIGGLGVNVRFCRVPVYWRVMVRGGGRGPMAGVGGLLVEGSRRIGETRDMGQGVAGSAGRVILAR